MNDSLSSLRLRLYTVDGRIQTFYEKGPPAGPAFPPLDPLRFFAEETVRINDSASEHSFPTSTLTRVDLITDQLSVWDFPFIMGALTF